MIMRIVVLLMFFFLTACSTVPDTESMSASEAASLPIPPLLDDAFFGEPLDVYTVSQVFALTDQQQQDFRAKLKSPRYKSLPPSRQIYRYIQNRLKDFNYHSDTLTATDVLSRETGNCLSLAIMTRALVNLTDVEITYELVETPPIYQSEGGMLLSSQHIRTVLSDPKAARSFQSLTLFQNKLTIDYFPVSGTRALRMVDENEFYSMFYRNKAAEAMVANNTNLAFWNLKAALKLKPDDAQAINMMGLLHARLGYPGYAEALYLYGLEHGIEKLEILNNYHALLKRLNRTEDANKIALRLEQYDDPNPFKWIQLADIAYAGQNYDTAIFYYKKAARMADYLHEPYAGIARSQYMLGNSHSARQSMKIALKKSDKPDFTALYQAKYELFSGSSGRN